MYPFSLPLAYIMQRNACLSHLTETPVLCWPVRSYLIIYRPKTDPLEVVGVLKGRFFEETFESSNFGGWTGSVDLNQLQVQLGVRFNF